MEYLCSEKIILYAQSGGVTAVINATAAGIIEQASQYTEQFGTVMQQKMELLAL